MKSKTLINLLKNCYQRFPWMNTGYHPQFSLFLGAGASKTSGVPLAAEMVTEFESDYKMQHNIASLKDEKWYDRSTAYSELFERLYPEPSLRRDYIERLLEPASPSWGYVYLVNLLARRVFNTVFTTNFDDILNESCYLFSPDVRPITCAHDSAIRSIRISTTRAKIIKLHGDFLYDSIKNTLGELESLDKNMRDKFRQFASEYGMIVIGYSGGDRSIMDVFDALLASENSFPHGVYWCVRMNSDLNSKVDRLTRFGKFHVVEIDGFDEFMAELHDALFGDNHPVVNNPYFALGTRMARILNNLPRTSEHVHPILERDVIRLGDNVRNERSLDAVPMPYIYIAYAKLRDGDCEGAREAVLKQICDLRSTFGAVWTAVEIAADIESRESRQSFAKELTTAIEQAPAFHTEPNKLHNHTLLFISKGQLKLASELLECGRRIEQGGRKLADPGGRPFDFDLYEINKAQILIRQGKQLSRSATKNLRKIVRESKHVAVLFGAFIVLRQYKRAVDALEAGKMSGEINARLLADASDWPIAKLLNNSQAKRLEKLVDE